MDSELYQYFFATEFVGENNFGSINFLGVLQKSALTKFVVFMKKERR